MRQNLNATIQIPLHTHPQYNSSKPLTTYHHWILSILFLKTQKTKHCQITETALMGPWPNFPFKGWFLGTEAYNVNQRSKQDPMDQSLTSETYVCTNAADFPRCVAEGGKKLSWKVLNCPLNTFILSFEFGFSYDNTKVIREIVAVFEYTV